MTRLSRRLQEIEEFRALRDGKPTETMQHINESGDALEFAARVALGSFAARGVRADESDVFRVGYLTACKELAMALRHMRAGTHPTPTELDEARTAALDELEQQPVEVEHQVGAHAREIAVEMREKANGYPELGDWLRKMAARVEQA